MTALDTMLVVIYLAGMLMLGYRGFRLSRSSADYMVAGRRLGLPLYSACLAATALGGASTIGGVKLGYQYGLSGAWLVLMIGGGILALGLLLSSRIAGLGVVSISEMLGGRYDPRTRVLSAVVMAAYLEMIAVVQMIAIGSIFSVIFDVTLPLAIFAGGMIVVTYTVLGGMWSVSMTDFVQFLLMTVGIFFLLLPAGLHAAGGWSVLVARVPADALQFDAIGRGRIGSLFLLYFLGLLIGQDIWQRVFTARTPAIARRGALLVGVYCMTYAGVTAVIGMVAAVLLPALDDPQLAFATLTVEVLPPGLIGLVFAGSLSALMSTASGPLLSTATLLSNDLYRRFTPGDMSDARFLAATRWLTAAAGAGAIALALVVGDVIKALDVAYTFISGSLFVPVMAGLFWPRASATAALYSIVASMAAGGVGMVLWGAGSGKPIIAAITISLATLVAVSLLGPRGSMRPDYG